MRVGVVNELLFRFSTSRSVPEIFAIKVEKCKKSRRILNVFALPNFRGRAYQKLFPCYHHLPRDTSHGKASWDIPTSPEVICVHTLNLQLLNFHDSSFLGDLRPRWGVRSVPWSISSTYKKERKLIVCCGVICVNCCVVVLYGRGAVLQGHVRHHAYEMIVVKSRQKRRYATRDDVDVRV